MPRFYVCAATIVAMALALATRTQAQAVRLPETPSGQITGTVTDVKGDAIVGATIILTRSPESTDQRTVLTTENGFFRFDALPPAVSYNIAINPDRVAECTSPPPTPHPRQLS